MKKQFLKLCLASILSLSLNANLQAQESVLPAQAAQEITVTKDISSEVQKFIEETKKHCPIEIEFVSQDSALHFGIDDFILDESDPRINDVFNALATQEWLSSLKSLYIVECNPHDANVLANVLSNAPQLETLGLVGLGLEKDYLEALTPALTSAPRLQNLDLASNDIGLMEDDNFKALNKCLSSLTNLHTLSLEYNSLQKMSSKGWLSLAQSLSSAPNLHTLNLTYNSLGVLETDEFGRDTTGVNNFESFVKFLSSLTKLQVLDLSWNNLLPYDNESPRVEEAQKLFADFLSSASNLRELYLRYNSLASTMEVLASALAQMTNLQVLDLSWNNLNKDVAPLAPALKKMTNLQVLNLKNNNIGTHFSDLVPAILQMPKLQKLNLAENELGKTTPSLCDLIPNLLHYNSTSLSTLRVLNLRDNYLGEELSALVPLIAQMPNLQKLNLAGNNLENLIPSKRQELIEALSFTTDLRKLSLDLNELVDSGMESFIDDLSQSESIAGIPNLMHTSASEASESTHPLELVLLYNGENPYKDDKLQKTINEYNPNIKLSTVVRPGYVYGQKTTENNE